MIDVVLSEVFRDVNFHLIVLVFSFVLKDALRRVLLEVLLNESLFETGRVGAWKFVVCRALVDGRESCVSFTLVIGMFHQVFDFLFVKLCGFTSVITLNVVFVNWVSVNLSSFPNSISVNCLRLLTHIGNYRAIKSWLVVSRLYKLISIVKLFISVNFNRLCFLNFWNFKNRSVLSLGVHSVRLSRHSVFINRFFMCFYGWLNISLVTRFVCALVSFGLLEFYLFWKFLEVLVVLLLKFIFLTELCFCRKFVNWLVFELILNQKLFVFKFLYVWGLYLFVNFDWGKGFRFWIENVVWLDCCHRSSLLELSNFVFMLLFDCMLWFIMVFAIIVILAWRFVLLCLFEKDCLCLSYSLV